MNKLEVWAFGGAAALTTAVVYAVCAAAVLVSAQGTLAFFNAWVHGIDLAPLLPAGGKPLTWSGFFYGLGATTATAYLSGALLAFFYNRLACGSSRAGAT